MQRLVGLVVVLRAASAVADPGQHIDLTAGGDMVIPTGDWAKVSGVGLCPLGDFEYSLTERWSLLARAGGCGHVSITIGAPAVASDTSTSEAYLLGGGELLLPRFRLYALVGLGTFGLKMSSANVNNFDVAAPAWVGASFLATRRLGIGIGAFSPDIAFGGLHGLTASIDGHAPARISFGIAATLTFYVWGWTPKPAPTPTPPLPEPTPTPPPVAPAPTPTPSPTPTPPPVVQGTEVRGVVRASGTGAAIVSTITLAPGGYTTQSAADGSFQIAVPPGTYAVTIRAAGFTSQVISKTVQPNEVAIVNVDLYPTGK